MKRLLGVRVLVGRARGQADELASRLRKEGAQVTTVPFIEIAPPRSWRPLDETLRRLAEYDWLVLTSVNGVEALRKRAAKLRVRTAAFRHLKIAAIGPATRVAIGRWGLRAVVMPRQYVAEAVVAALARRVRGKRVLLVRARVARDVIPSGLRAAGARMSVVEAYETKIPKSSAGRLRSLLRQDKSRPHVITFTSSSTVRNFVKMIGRREIPRGVLLASIGPVTSATMRQCGLPVGAEARTYTTQGLVAAIVAAHRRRSG